MPRLSPLAWSLAFGFILCCATSTFAAPDNPRKFAITNPAEADDDFAFQGEYLGTLRLPHGQLERTGLQVVAQGDGKLIATQMRGGLPGSGWNERELLELEGRREGNRAILSAGQYQITLHADNAAVVNSEGISLGSLSKVERRSATEGLPPGPLATVLFDGGTPENLKNAKINEEGYLMVGPTTAEPVEDFRMHMEFRLPYMPYARSQARANSGVYIQRRYEVQILDSFGLRPQFNDGASMYRTQPPNVNMGFPPLRWQTYDIYFTAARFDDQGNRIAQARITVLHNGIKVHDNFALPNKTGAGKPEGAEPLPTLFQDHGNPVVFRNIWIEPLGARYAATPAPASCIAF
ncbi:MAG: DUF1080 domain-containing protein [Pirellulaceae bacterium]